MTLDCLMPAESGDSVRLLIARHGETRDNASGRWQGWNDSPLTEKGAAQAAELARRLAGERIAAVYASDLGRAAHTARLAMPHLDVASHLSPALRERNVGVFSGLTGPEVEARHADALGRRTIDGVLDWAPPEGESFRQILARALPFLESVRATHEGASSASSGQSVLIVTHGGVIRLLAAYATDQEWEGLYRRHPSNCGLSVFTLGPRGALTLERFDEHDFLQGPGAPPLAEDGAG